LVSGDFATWCSHSATAAYVRNNAVVTRVPKLDGKANFRRNCRVLHSEACRTTTTISRQMSTSIHHQRKHSFRHQFHLGNIASSKFGLPSFETTFISVEERSNMVDWVLDALQAEIMVVRCTYSYILCARRRIRVSKTDVDMSNHC
jgi:hypothetical protein